jgi:hypothetical protein
MFAFLSICQFVILLVKFVNAKTKSIIESLVVYVLYLVKTFTIFTNFSLFSLNQLVNVQNYNKFIT